MPTQKQPGNANDGGYTLRACVLRVVEHLPITLRPLRFLDITGLPERLPTPGRTAEWRREKPKFKICSSVHADRAPTRLRPFKFADPSIRAEKAKSVIYRPRYDPIVTGPPYRVPPEGAWPPPTALTRDSTLRRKQSALPLALGVVVGVIGITVGVLSWIRPTGSADPAASAPVEEKHSEQEVALAKQELCAAHALVDRATRAAASRTSDDPSIRGLLSLNVRIGATVSAAFLRATLDRNPAAPPDLADAISDVAIEFNNGTLLQIAEAPQPELDLVFKRLDAADAKAERACE